MTLLEMIPSLQPAMLPRLSPAIWPRGTEYDGEGRITLGGVALTDIADRFGTPTYVLDGFPIGSETAAEAVRRVLARPDLELVGLHCHLGSQIHDPDHYGEAIQRLVGEMAWIRREHHHLLTELDLGGGHAVAYRPGDAELNLAELADIVEDALDAACARHRFPRPARWRSAGNRTSRARLTGPRYR